MNWEYRIISGYGLYFIQRRVVEGEDSSVWLTLTSHDEYRDFVHQMEDRGGRMGANDPYLQEQIKPWFSFKTEDEAKAKIQQFKNGLTFETV